MIRLQVQLALVLIAALVLQSEAWLWWSRRSSRRTSTSVCRRPPTGQGVVRKGCSWPYQEGETCDFECRDGYRRTSGDTSRDCNGGTWTGQPLVCEYTGCDRLPYIRGSSRTGCRWPYENGDSCSYTCWNGYTAVSGDSVITCNNRTWSGTPLICVYTGCTRPSFTWYSTIQGCWWPYVNGENCSYTCRDGYSAASGNSTITCVDGAWSGTPLQCRRTSGCDRPPRRFGSWGPSNCRMPYEEGETCTFRCRRGYEQQSGNTSTICTGGQWTGDPLVCTRTSPGRRG